MKFMFQVVWEWLLVATLLFVFIILRYLRCVAATWKIAYYEKILWLASGLAVISSLASIIGFTRYWWLGAINCLSLVILYVVCQIIQLDHLEES